MVYTINKGEHRSAWFPQFTTKTKLQIGFQFISDPSYILDNKTDQNDTNKIFGISDSWHHQRHSIRLGWRYDTKLEKSICCVYFYRNGKHFIEDLGEIEQGIPYFFDISILRDEYTVVALDKKLTIPRTSNWRGLRYLLFPYFGGQQVAPKQFQIRLLSW
jgi:hypothetical protein